MTQIRTMVRFFIAAMLLAGFALPSQAAKEHSINVTPLLSPVPTTFPGAKNVMVTIRNETPGGGNSTINSFWLFIPDGIEVDTTKLAVDNSGMQVVMCAGATNKLCVNGFDGLKAGLRTPYFLNVNLRARYASATSCSSYAWTATVFTGNAFGSSQEFAPVQPSGTTNTQSLDCVLSFKYPPNNALSGVIITSTPFNNPVGNFVQVELRVNGVLADSSYNSQVVMTSTCSGLAGSTANLTNGVAVFSGLTITSATATSCTLTATVVGKSVTSSSFGIAPFAIEGIIACNQVMDAEDALPPEVLALLEADRVNAPGYVFAKRGPFNSKGDPCKLVNFSFDNKVLFDDTLILKWDTVTQPNAVFFYSVNSNARLLSLTTLTPDFVAPNVAWEFDAAGAPINSRPALSCISPSFPRPYGELPIGGLSAGTLSVTLVKTALPLADYQPLPLPSATFPIYIDSERMIAQVSSGTTLNLTRGQAGTTPDSHSAGKYAMSTPLPIDPRGGPPGCTTGTVSPYCGKAVRMCMGAYGFQTYTPDPVTGNPRYFQLTDVFDIGDGKLSFN